MVVAPQNSHRKPSDHEPKGFHSSPVWELSFFELHLAWSTP